MFYRVTINNHCVRTSPNFNMARMYADELYNTLRDIVCNGIVENDDILEEIYHHSKTTEDIIIAINGVNYEMFIPENEHINNYQPYLDI